MKQRRIRLIEPGCPHARLLSAWVSRWPLLGPVMLGTILASRGHDVAIYNENMTGPVLEDAGAMEDICSADVVGISIMTPTADQGYRIADAVRAACGAKIVFGGPHATFMPAEALQHGHIVVQGEGETLIEAIARAQVPDGIVHGEPLDDLDSLPALDHSLVKGFDQMVSRFPRKLYELPVMTSRGCPHGCTYCSVTRLFGRRVRRQSVEKVCKDMDAYQKRGFDQFIFYDDNFTSDRHWCRELMDRLQRRGIGFHAQTRADFHWKEPARRNLDWRMLEGMSAAGGDVLYIGYETTDERTAAAWKKGYRGGECLRKRLEEDTRILHDYGFWIHGMFVLGPQHSGALADSVLHFARANRLESIQVTALTPFPGTPLYEQTGENLLFRQYPGDWNYYDGTHCLYRDVAMGLEGFQRKLLELHERFYRRWGGSLRRARNILKSPMSLRLRLRNLWDNVRIARRTLDGCRREMETFLLEAGNRLDQSTELTSLAEPGA